MASISTAQTHQDTDNGETFRPAGLRAEAGALDEGLPGPPNRWLHRRNPDCQVRTDGGA